MSVVPKNGSCFPAGLLDDLVLVAEQELSKQFDHLIIEKDPAGASSTSSEPARNPFSFEPRRSRVGEEYQAVLPDVVLPKPSPEEVAAMRSRPVLAFQTTSIPDIFSAEAKAEEEGKASASVASNEKKSTPESKHSSRSIATPDRIADVPKRPRPKLWTDAPASVASGLKLPNNIPSMAVPPRSKPVSSTEDEVALLLASLSGQPPSPPPAAKLKRKTKEGEDDHHAEEHVSKSAIPPASRSEI